jgi:hypothetical protein
MGFRNLFPIPAAEDWNGVRRAFEAIQHALGIESEPTFNEVTVTTDITVGGDATISGDMTVSGTITATGGLTLGGDLNMGCNEIQNFKIHIVADASAMGALACGQGQACFRQDTDKFYGRLS